MRYVEPEVAEAVHSLAAARAFDETIYHELGAALKFATRPPAFRSLIRFSFVWKASGRGDGWYGTTTCYGASSAMTATP